MPTLLIVMILGGGAFAFWSAARGAAERAETLGRQACQSAGVQLLDQTVHANGLRLRRGESGKIGFERKFRFEYSDDGIHRHVGHFVLRGDVLIGFNGPVQAASAIRLH